MNDRNKQFARLLTVLLCINATWFAATAFAGDELISRVKLSEKSFNPDANETTVLSFELSESASLNVSFHNQLGETVKDFAVSNAAAGMQQVVWDGLDNNGERVPGSVFLYTIEATTQNGNKCFYNRADETGGIKSEPLQFKVSRKNGELEFVLPKACMVRLTAGLRDGMFAKEIMDWTPMTAGRHDKEWDGKDHSGTLDLLRHPDLDVRLMCFTLPDNTVIVTGEKIPFEPIEKPDPQQNEIREKIWSTKGKYLHYRHDPRLCKAPKFDIAFPTATVDGDNIIIPKAKNVPIRVTIDPEDLWHATSARFEIMLFLDGIFFYEIEEGSSPFTFHWNTLPFSKGPHVLTVNIVLYDGHIGIDTRKIILEDQS